MVGGEGEPPFTANHEKENDHKKNSQEKDRSSMQNPSS